MESHFSEFDRKALSTLLKGVDLDYFYSTFGVKNFFKSYQCHLLIHAHCLPSFLVMIVSLIKDFNFPPENIVIVPKPYSSISHVLHSLNSFGVCVVDSNEHYRPGYYDNSQYLVLYKACMVVLENVRRDSYRKNRVIVVDDGGLITTVWDGVNKSNSVSTISIQHTASGIGRKPWNVSKVDVARSAAKRFFESKVIAKSIVKKLDNIDFNFGNKVIGVAGLGVVGGALVKSISDRAEKIFCLEKILLPVNDSGVEIERSVVNFLKRSDIIFGCTGVNWSSGFSNPNLFSGKVFISCSSRDIEFKGILEKFSTVTEKHDFDNIILNVSPDSIVYNSGFPINFDREKEWETYREISLTRYLILSAVVMAQFIKDDLSINDTIMLPVKLQKTIVCDWIYSTGILPEEFGVDSANINSMEWWQRNSGGTSIT